MYHFRFLLYSLRSETETVSLPFCFVSRNYKINFSLPFSSIFLLCYASLLKIDFFASFCFNFLLQNVCISFRIKLFGCYNCTYFTITFCSYNLILCSLCCYSTTSSSISYIVTTSSFIPYIATTLSSLNEFNVQLMLLQSHPIFRILLQPHSVLLTLCCYNFILYSFCYYTRL